MEGQFREPRFRPAILAATSALVGLLLGCQGANAPQWLTGGPRTDVVPGIPSPSERIDTLRKLGDAAAGTEPAEQTQIAAQLAAAYREESDPIIREEIVRAVAGYRTTEAAAVLDTAVNDSAAGVRIAACEAWGRIGGAQATPRLATVLSSDVDPDVRLAAAKALGRTGDPSAAVSLGLALEDRNPALQYQAVQSLKALTGRSYGKDVNRWRQYVQSQFPQDRDLVAERPRQSY